MHKLQLGSSGLVVSAVGLGCSRLGSTLGTAHGVEGMCLVHHAIDAGVTLFDTADIYGQGDSERLLGRAVRSHRNNVVIVTKAGQRFATIERALMAAKHPLRHLARLVPGVRAGLSRRRGRPLARDYRPGFIKRKVEGSLRRLGTDVIDVFLLHSPSAEDVRLGLSFELLDRLVHAGTIRTWGISCDDMTTLDAALDVPSVRVVQVPLMLAASPALPSLAAAVARGVGILVREVFASIPTQPGMQAARQQAIATALSIPGAAALVGTTNSAHLTETLALVRTGESASSLVTNLAVSA